ncbi:MAG: hemerythrin domain-containing protein [Salinivirgaceae bacterium]
MPTISSEQALADVLYAHPELLPICNRFEIKTGLGNATIAEICSHKNIDTEFFTAIINIYLNPDIINHQALSNVPVSELVAYLKKTHQYYLTYALPLIDDKLTRLTTSCKTVCIGIKAIKTFYDKYKNELLTHINYEEEVVFPYIDQLLKKSETEKHYSIGIFEKEHTNIEQKINDLKTLIIKHLDPTFDANACNEFLFELTRFENDITDHARIEDILLIPEVEKLEKTHR